MIRTEDKIIDAARRIFREKGKDGARMQEIADLAGINKALVHYYFRSKDILFDRVFETELKEVLHHLLTTVNDRTDFYTFIHDFVQTYLNNIAPRRNVIRFVLWEADNKQDQFFVYLSESFKEHGYTENPIIRRITKAIDSGEIRRCDPVNLVLSILSMAIFPFIAAPILERIFPGLDISDQDFIDHRTSELTGFIWNGVKPEE